MSPFPLLDVSPVNHRACSIGYDENITLNLIREYVMKILLLGIFNIFIIMLLQGCATTAGFGSPEGVNMSTQPIATTPQMFRSPPAGAIRAR